MLPQVEKELKQSFEAVKISEIAQGKNHLTFNIAVDVVTQFLRNEIAFLEELQNNNQVLTILNLEQKMESSNQTANGNNT